MTSPTTYTIAAEERVGLPRFGSRTVSLRISHVPRGTSDADLDDMISEADRACTKLGQALRARVAAMGGLDLTALDGKPTVEPERLDGTTTEVPLSDNCPVCNGDLIVSVGNGGTRLTYCATCAGQEPTLEPERGGDDAHSVAASTAEAPLSDPWKCSICYSQLVEGRAPNGEDPDWYCPFCDPHEEEIPHESEVLIDRDVFGVQIGCPLPGWHDEPLTAINSDGTGGGQLRAVNAALTAIKHGGKKRHAAALAILVEYGEIDGPARRTLESINELTKAEAHIVLDWIEKGADDPAALLALKRAPNPKQKELSNV